MFKKRKTDAEGGRFNERWESEYMFVLQGEKMLCLLCYGTVSVIKECILCQYFDTKCVARFAKICLLERHSIVQELKGGLQSQQNIFTKATAQSDMAVMLALLCFSEGTFLKQYMPKVCKKVCPNQTKGRTEQ